MLSVDACSKINEITLDGISLHESEEVKSALIEELENLLSNQALHNKFDVDQLMKKIDSIEVEVEETATPREIGKEIAISVFKTLVK